MHLPRPVLAAAALAAMAVLVPASAAATSGSHAAPAHLSPGCHRVTLAGNSGNGPFWHLIICDGDDALLLVDGGPMGPGAVIFGEGRDVTR